MERYTLLKYFVNALLILIYHTTLLPLSFSFYKKSFLFFCIFFLLFFLSPLGQISSFLFLPIICTLIFLLARPRLLSLCCSLWGYLCGVVLNYFCLLAADAFFCLSIADLSQYYFIPFTLLDILLTYGVLRVFRYLFLKKLKLFSLNLPAPVLISCFFCLLICCVIFITNFTYGETIGYPPFILRLNAFLFTTFFALAGLLLFFIIREVVRNQEYKKRLVYLSMAQEYSASLDASYKELRKFKHDYHNVLLALSGYIQSKDLSGIQNYFCHSLFPLYQKINAFSENLVLDSLRISEVRGLCLNKAFIAQSLGVTVKFSVPSEISSLRMESVDFIRILGIYFDNAIEAAEKSKEKVVECSFYSDGKEATFLLMNSFSNEELTLDALSGSGYTTKGMQRGNGLGIVKDILKNYPEIGHQTYIKNHYVIQELLHL